MRGSYRKREEREEREEIEREGERKNACKEESERQREVSKLNKMASNQRDRL